MSEPQDPFKLNEAEARALFAMTQSYIDAGYRRSEAMAITLAFISIQRPPR